MNDRPGSGGSEWRRNWPLVAAGTSGMSLASLSTAAFGVMVVPMEQELGWSRTQISVGPSLISFGHIGLGMLFGYAIDRFGPRRIALLGVGALCLVTAMMSQIGDRIWQWWALWGVIAVASAINPTVWIASISRFFSSSRGLAMAVVLSGSGISSSLVPVIANHFVEDFGWRTAYLYLAIIWTVVVFPLVLFFFKGKPEASAAPPPAAGERSPPPETLPGLTVRQGFRSLVFYKLTLATVAGTCAGIALVLNLVPVLRSTGLTPATAAAVAGSIGIATIAGRVVSGALMDRFRAGVIASSASALMILLPVMLLAFPGSVPASILGVVTYGLMGGAMMPCVAYLASKHLGARAFGTLYATINAAMSIGIGLGPILANYVYDQIQSYTPVLWTAIPLFALGALLFASLGPYPTFATEREPA